MTEGGFGMGPGASFGAGEGAVTPAQGQEPGRALGPAGPARRWRGALMRASRRRVPQRRERIMPTMS